MAAKSMTPATAARDAEDGPTEMTVLLAPATKAERSSVRWLGAGVCGLVLFAGANRGSLRLSGGGPAALKATVVETSAAPPLMGGYRDCLGEDIVCTDLVLANTPKWNPETCAVPDGVACGIHCTNPECETLCGAFCDGGAGAVCALTVYSNLDAVCECAADASSGALATDAQAIVAGLVTAQLEADMKYNPHSSKDLAGAVGEDCDHHAMCNFCSEDCFVLREGSCSAASAMAQLATVQSTCDTFCQEQHQQQQQQQ